MSEWPSGLRRQTQGVISFSVVEVSGLHVEAWGSNPTSDKGYFIIGSVFETVNNIFSIIYFAIWPMPMIELSLISLCKQVRMAERSKAPDSRHCQLLNCWGFWSPHGGVGSNPTSDTSSFWIGSNVETVNLIVSFLLLPSDQLHLLNYFKSHFSQRLFYNWKRFWDRKHSSFYRLFAIWPMQIFNII